MKEWSNQKTNANELKLCGESERFLYKTRGVITDSEFSSPFCFLLCYTILCRILQSRDSSPEHRHEAEWVVGPTYLWGKLNRKGGRERMEIKKLSERIVTEEKSETAINNPLHSTTTKNISSWSQQMTSRFQFLLFSLKHCCKPSSHSCFYDRSSIVRCLNYYTPSR